ncbi:MAG: nuclear transport factor 2 family protein [Gemmatimonadota bacterium]|jgi:uncharacterized protein (TIGR02246 family)
MARHVLPISIVLALSLTIAHPGASQSLTAADQDAIRAVWAEMDASAMAGDVARLSGIYAENAVEVFQPDQISYGKEAILERIGSGIEGLRVSAHESRVEGIMGERDAAVVWVKNTQTHVNRQTGAERSYDLEFAAVMSREADGSWKIAYFRFVWPD